MNLSKPIVIAYTTVQFEDDDGGSSSSEGDSNESIRMGFKFMLIESDS